MGAKKAAVALAMLALGASAVTACSSGGGSGSSSNNGTGAITFITGKDNSNLMPHIAAAWNAAHPKEKVTIKQQSDQADAQHNDLVQHFQAKDAHYDVVTVDVVWSAEFAAKGWLVPLTGSKKLDTSKLLPATVKAATYNNTLYAAPYASDGGLLYYRKDLVPTAPKTWDELIADCKGKTSNTITGSKPACYAGQFAKYEGLTVNAAEAINAAGGTIVKSDGKTPTVDTAAAAKGLDFLANGFKQGYIPKEALGFQETQSINAFQAGQLVFMRNWPYADAILSGKGSKVAGKYGIAPLPGPSGHGASSLGGHSVAISKYSAHQATAFKFLQFLETPDIQRYNLVKGTNAPVLQSLYSDPALVKQFRYLPILLTSIKTAVPRPVTPFYPAVTDAIETNAYAALQGTKSVTSALKDLQAAIKTATGG
ncbi:MAG: ABC transporter substrate-binding protein [Actinomycetota bacterium]|nr:ABC transporter substrate-binding protein [Actinomycetota bacterium]